jgi:Flp pilus assembly protein CpaB
MQPHPASPFASLARVGRRLRRAVLVRRRLLAAVLMALAVLAGVRAAAGPPGPTVPVVVARTDLSGGSVLRPGDLEVVHLPEDHVPDGTVANPTTVADRVLAAPLRRGEPLTDVRLVAPGLLAGYPGAVAVPVRVADAGAADLLRVGDRIDLIAASPEGGGASVIVADAPVVALPRPVGDGARSGPGSGSGPALGNSPAGGLVVVAVDPASALTLAEAAVSAVLSVTLNG